MLKKIHIFRCEAMPFPHPHPRITVGWNFLSFFLLIPLLELQKYASPLSFVSFACFVLFSDSK